MLSAKNIAHSAWGQIVTASASLVGIRVYTELMSTKEFGYAMMAMGVIALLDGLVTLAFNQTLLSLCAQILNRDSERHVAAGLAFSLVRSVGLIMALALVVMVPLAIVFGAGPLAAASPIIAFLYLTEEIAKTSMLAPLIAAREYFRFSTWSASEAMLGLVATSAFLYFFKADTFSYLAGMMVGRAASTSLFLCVFFQGRYFMGVDIVAALPFRDRAVSYGWPVSIMAPLGWSAVYLDRYVLTMTGGASVVGVYTAVVGLIGRPFALTGSILTNYFRPQLFRADMTDGEPGSRRKTLLLWIASALAIGAFGTLCALILGNFVVSLTLASEYHDGARPIMVFMALAQTFVMMTHACDNAVFSTGATSRLLKTQMSLVIVTLTLLPLGIMWSGALGAAMARASAEGIKFGVTLNLAYRLLKY
nr:oligosaccharide flippase family protein [uncultured Rhodopila sp.]